MTKPEEKQPDSSAKAKQRVSDEQRRLVLDLRRHRSLREVAETTVLPLGAVGATTGSRPRQFFAT